MRESINQAVCKRIFHFGVHAVTGSPANVSHHMWRLAHVFCATGENHIRHFALNFLHRVYYRLESRPTEAVDCQCWRGKWKLAVMTNVAGKIGSVLEIN